MGQAKLRGTFEERKEASTLKRQEILKRRILDRIAREQTMTIEEQLKRKKAQQFIALTAGLVGLAEVK